jgi:hypothetical protein
MEILNPEAYLHAANWLAKQKRDHLTPAERQTLLVLAGFSNSKGQAWPTISTIADRVGASEKTIQRALRELEHQRCIQTNRNPMSSDTRIISEDIVPSLQTDPEDRSSCPPITNNSIRISFRKEESSSTMVVDGQLDRGFEDPGRFPVRRELSTHARLDAECRELIQPLVDHAIDALVAIGKKEPKWAATDKIADDWHWFIFDAVINREVYSPGITMRPDDPLWFEILEEALFRLTKNNSGSIMPDQRLTETIVEVREEHESEARRREEEVQRREESQTVVTQTNQEKPKPKLLSDELAILEERDAQKRSCEELLPRFSSSTSS